MKNARVCLWNAKATQNPKAPILSGSVQLPAQLVWELSQLLQANQGFEINPKTGEQFFKLHTSVWQADGANNGPVLNGQIESPSEHQAYLNQKAAQGGGGGQWGGQPAAAPAAPAASVPAQMPPAPAPPAPAAPAWGAPMPGQWGG